MIFKLPPTENTLRFLGATEDKIRQFRKRNENERNQIVLKKINLQKQILPNGRKLLSELDLLNEVENKKMVVLLLEFCIENNCSDIGFEGELLFAEIDGIRIELGFVAADVPKKFSLTILKHYDFVRVKQKIAMSPKYGDAFEFSRPDDTMREFRLFSPLMNNYYKGSGAYLFNVREAQDCSKQHFVRLLHQTY